MLLAHVYDVENLSLKFTLQFPEFSLFSHRFYRVSERARGVKIIEYCEKLLYRLGALFEYYN